MALYEGIKSLLPPSVVRYTAPMHFWQPGVTPLSTVMSVVAMSVGYITIVLGGQAVMRHLPAVPARVLKIPFFLHNVLLCLGSLLLLCLYLELEIPIIFRYGLHNSICEFRLYFDAEMFHIINYYFKYWEFADTLFLVLKKKKLLFLHVYHHMATAALCYSQIVNQTTLSWVIICLNLAVHVIMYGYYALASIGVRCPWKQLVTTGQIVQFVIDVVVCIYGIYHHYVHLYAPWLPYVRYCHGEPAAAFSGLGILVSYLVLFIFFYRDTYKKAPKADKKTQ